MKQEEMNKTTFSNDDNEDLDRQYNERLLRRAGSPDISKKKGTPNAPHKTKKKHISRNDATEELKKKNISNIIRAGPCPVALASYVQFSMGDVVLKTEPGKIIYTKEISRKETGGRFLNYC